MLKFSIIIPVYNVEKYLSMCLDSITNQTYKNLEIICINDGSTDNSLLILEKYAKNDSRIKIITQENQGVSVSRNLGIKNAVGDYLLFVDSDDWLELDACEIINQNLDKNIDILFFGYKFIKNNKVYNKDNYNQLVLNNNYDNIRMLDCRTIWGKAYNTKKLKNSNINFSANLSFGEDTLFIIKNFLNAESIKVVSNSLYNYRMDNNFSLTKINHKKQLEQLLILIDELDLFFKDKKVDEKLKLYIYDDTFYFIALLWYLYYSKYKKDFINTINSIRKIYFQYDVNFLSSLKGYKRIKRYLTLQKYHLLWLYLYVIRPIGKHCIIIPIRKIKNWRN